MIKLSDKNFCLFLQGLALKISNEKDVFVIAEPVVITRGYYIDNSLSFIEILALIDYEIKYNKDYCTVTCMYSHKQIPSLPKDEILFRLDRICKKIKNIFNIQSPDDFVRSLVVYLSDSNLSRTGWVQMESIPTQQSHNILNLCALPAIGQFEGIDQIREQIVSLGKKSSYFQKRDIEDYPGRKAQVVSTPFPKIIQYFYIRLVKIKESIKSLETNLPLTTIFYSL